MKILDIKEDVSIESDKWRSIEGYEIITDKGSIKVGVSNYQLCCEDWGYFTSEDNLQDFLGAEVIQVDLVDKELKVYEKLRYLEDGGAMFVNVVTNKGTLQLVAYNCHNGYYGHNAVYIDVDGNKHEESL